MADLDDFSLRRLREMPSIGRLRSQVRQASLAMMAGLLVTNYSRRDLDILRQAGMLNGHELDLLGRLDRSHAEYAALADIAQSDTDHCAHCGKDITRARNVIAVTIMGAEHRYHGSRPACARAARWLRTPADRANDKPTAPVHQLGANGPVESER